MKLELKHLAPYLPYGLEIQRSTKIEEQKGTENEKDVVILTPDFLDVCIKNDHPYFDCKPMFRNLSQLTEQIEHDGQKFIPIVELMQMCFAHVYSIRNSNGFEVLPTAEEFPKYFGCKSVDYFPTDEDRRDFGFSIELEQFQFSCDGNMLCIDQFALRNKLYEWHFDVFGLIEKGLAIEKLNDIPRKA